MLSFSLYYPIGKTWFMPTMVICHGIIPVAVFGLLAKLHRTKDHQESQSRKHHAKRNVNECHVMVTQYLVIG